MPEPTGPSDAAVLDEARERFALDPLFHAQVKRVVGIVAEDCRQMTGQRLTYDEEGAATVAAAAALVLFATGPYRSIHCPHWTEHGERCCECDAFTLTKDRSTAPGGAS